MVNPFMPVPQPAPSGGLMPPGPSLGPQFQQQPESFIQYKPDSRPEYGPYSDGEADKLQRNNRRGSQPTKGGEAGMVCRSGH